MTIMVLGKNASSPVTCLDLLCCAKPCRAFSKKKGTTACWLLYPAVPSALSWVCGSQGTGLQGPEMTAALPDMGSQVSESIWCKSIRPFTPTKSEPKKKTGPSSCASTLIKVQILRYTVLKQSNTWTNTSVGISRFQLVFGTETKAPDPNILCLCNIWILDPGLDPHFAFCACFWISRNSGIPLIWHSQLQSKRCKNTAQTTPQCC